MMTSRTEYRLLHRQDNADQRLTPIGHRIGLVRTSATARAVEEKYAAVEREIQRLEHTGVPASPELNAMLEEKGESAPKGGSARLADLVRRPRISYADLESFDPGRPALDRLVREQVEISMKYEGYIARQMRQVEEFQRLESHALPAALDYAAHGRPASGGAGKAQPDPSHQPWPGQPHLRGQSCRHRRPDDLAGKAVRGIGGCGNKEQTVARVILRSEAMTAPEGACKRPTARRAALQKSV